MSIDIDAHITAKRRIILLNGRLEVHWIKHILRGLIWGTD